MSIRLVHYDFSSYRRRDTEALDRVREQFIRNHPVYRRASDEIGWDLLSEGSQLRYWAIPFSEGGPPQMAEVEARTTLSSILSRVEEHAHPTEVFGSEEDATVMVRAIVMAGDAYLADQATGDGSSLSEYRGSLAEVRSTSSLPRYEHTVTREYGAYAGDPRAVVEEERYDFTEVIEFVPSAPPWSTEDTLYEYVSSMETKVARLFRSQR